MDKDEKTAEKHFIEVTRSSRFGSEDWFNAVYCLAGAAFAKKEYGKALPYFESLERAENQCVSVSDESSRVLLYTCLALIWSKKNKLAKAETYLRKAELLDKALAEPEFELKHMYFMTDVLRKKGELGKALEWLEERVRLFEASTNKPDYYKLFAAKQLCVVLEEMGNLEKSADFRKGFFERQVDAYLRAKFSPRERPEYYKMDDIDWGKDELSNLLEEAHYNTIAIWHNLGDNATPLKRLNAKFNVGLDIGRLYLVDLMDTDSLDVQLERLKLDDQKWLELFFYFNSHSAIVAAIRLALAGQNAESYCIMRSCLENAVYAYQVRFDSKCKEIWLSRNNGLTERKESSKAFNAGKIIRDEIPKRAGTLSKELSDLYEHTIDQGAHPNVNTFIENAQQVASTEEFAIGRLYLNPQNSEKCLYDVLAVGTAALNLYKVIFSDWLW